jgi:signal transduction histidine kinase
VSRPPADAAAGSDPLRLVEHAAVAEEILAGLRHDIGNRLAAVRNAAFYIRRRLSGSDACADDPRIERFLMVIDDEAAAAHASLQAGAVLERLAPRRSGSIDAAECARTAVALARIADPGVRVEVTSEPGAVDADPGELALAIRCLVENGAEAMPGGGLVAVRAAPDAERFVVEVSDGGPGIAEPDHDLVVRAFYTTKPGHAGLGLSIAQRIARRIGGALVIRASAGGAAVALSLPLATGRAG